MFIIAANRDDPAARRTVYDMYNDREVVLTERDIEIIRRMQAGAFAHPEHNDTPDYIDYVSCEKEIMPISAAPEPKARFLPSKWEMIRIMKIVKAIKEGRYVDRKAEDKTDLEKAQMLMIWNEAEDEILAESKRFKFHLPAPRMPLPGTNTYCTDYRTHSYYARCFSCVICWLPYHSYVVFEVIAAVAIVVVECSACFAI